MKKNLPLQMLLDKTDSLQQLLICRATGGEASNADYQELRRYLLSSAILAAKVPSFVKDSRNLLQFWHFIKDKFGTYAERRTYIWKEFRELTNHLEKNEIASDELITSKLSLIDSGHVDEIWRKALDRKDSDPEGAITASRTLIESTCKAILDEQRISYDDGDDLPALYKQTSRSINLSPTQHTEQIFKQILGGCFSVVSGIGALRNKVSDAHGKGKEYVKLAPIYAELMINLSGAISSFLIQAHKKPPNDGKSLDSMVQTANSK